MKKSDEKEYQETERGNVEWDGIIIDVAKRVVRFIYIGKVENMSTLAAAHRVRNNDSQ